jgi:aspartyl/glutamyl-tRNA(Asn/Gln) amidotransferase subunit B (EC 6.3.5.-)
MQQAIEYEVAWQIAELEEGRAITQATVLFDPATGETRAMRSKEDAMDYRYFPDPDLPPLVVSEAEIEAIRASLPELPHARAVRYQHEHALTAYEANQLAQERALADYFDAVVGAGASGKQAANWMLGELAAAMNREQLAIEQVPVKPAQLAGIIARIQDGTISHKIGKTVFDALWQGEGDSADAVIAARGLQQISDTGALAALVDQVLARSAAQIADYRAGKEKALMSIVGQVMKASQGKANPQQVNEIIRQRLAKQ